MVKMNNSKADITSRSVSLANVDQNQELLDFLIGEARIFQQPDFLSAVGAVEYIAAYKGDEIVGAMPLVVSKKMGIKSYHRPPYAHIYGPVVSSANESESGAIINKLLSHIDKYPITEFKLPIDNQDLLPYVNVRGTIIASQTHIVSNGTNYGHENIHSSKRRYLKKLEKELEKGGLILKEGKENNDEILWLQKQVANKRGFRSYIGTLEKIMNTLSETNAYSILLTTSNGDPIAGAFCPYDKFSAYHLVNASINNKDSLLNRTNLLSTYLAVSKANIMGIDFDFEGSNINGVASFYRMMGGQPTIHYRIQMARNIVGRSFLAIKGF